MNRSELFPKPAKRFAMATALLVLLGAVGCMTRHEGVMSAAGDVESKTAPTIDPAGDRCSLFSCEP